MFMCACGGRVSGRLHFKQLVCVCEPAVESGKKGDENQFNKNPHVLSAERSLKSNQVLSPIM
jgi:hypothetical protein